MACKFTRDDKGNWMIICSSPWGIGITKLSKENAEEFGQDSIYGFSSGRGNPHDFWPDKESCSEEEILAWEEACKVWDAQIKED